MFREKVQKISAARMVQMLQGLYPSRYDLSSEQEVNAVITSLAKREKEARMEATRKRLEEERKKKNNK